MTDYNHREDWFYEGKVSGILVAYLKRKGYKIIKDNSEKISQQGIDIVAISSEGVTELIEVKGYPTEFYTRSANKGKPKKTKPKLQAKHWFSEAILSCMFNYSKYSSHGTTRLCLAFPLDESGRYRELISKVEDYYAAYAIDFRVYFISKEGNVLVDNLNKTMR